ncbi:MAG: hypothetical protein K2N24_11415 [Lachnospiraceae bacterium]|nr:hypothetical protein [Lachnospiraceae bacterium]
MNVIRTKQETNKERNQKTPNLTRVIGIIVALLILFVGATQIVPKNDQMDDLGYSNEATLTFRNSSLLDEHYEKHGKEMGFSSAEEYEQAAAAVVMNTSALHKIEAEDGDDVYYIESTNEFVVVSTDGYIRTYFKPNSGIDYYNRQ